MKIKSTLFSLFLVLAFTVLTAVNVNAGIYVNETDTHDYQLAGFFDLRDRESFVQITNIDSDVATIHIQIFDVSNNCNENNFFDTYTGADTHVYNVRDILTNNGSPSGVVLPNDSYGIFVVVSSNLPSTLIGNLRVLDDNVYEYRSNLAGIGVEAEFTPSPYVYTFNFNTESGVTLSDIIGIRFNEDNEGVPELELDASNILDAWISWDVDIFNENEVAFSCRNVIFACTDQNNPLLEELLEESGDASVASFEYGINNSIPHSKGGELLCPGNTISEGFVRLNFLDFRPEGTDNFILYVGLNNGNGRGSLDHIWDLNAILDFVE